MSNIKISVKNALAFTPVEAKGMIGRQIEQLYCYFKIRISLHPARSDTICNPSQ